MTQDKVLKWRSSSQIRSIKYQLRGAISLSDSDIYVQVSQKTARNLLEICEQAEHTEKGHGV